MPLRRDDQAAVCQIGKATKYRRLGRTGEICDIRLPPRDRRMGEPSEHSAEHPREFPRFEVNAYVDYTGNEVLLFHRIQNISLGGVCIQTSGVEEVGTMVDLVLNFPDLDASIAITGEVVWANREPPMDMGIRYVDLDEERKDTLRKYINMVRSTRITDPVAVVRVLVEDAIRDRTNRPARRGASSRSRAGRGTAGSSSPAPRPPRASGERR